LEQNGKGKMGGVSMEMLETREKNPEISKECLSILP
jgi:hypothetical protein